MKIIPFEFEPDSHGPIAARELSKPQIKRVLKNSLAMRLLDDAYEALKSRYIKDDGSIESELKKYVDMAAGDLRRGTISENEAHDIGMQARALLWYNLDEEQKKQAIKKIESILKIGQ